MKAFFADTNLYLRFILQDNPKQFKEVSDYFKKAKKGKIKIIFLSEVLLEMEFVLRSVYSFTKEEITKALFSLVKIKYLDIKERDLWFEVFKLFQKRNFSLFDTFLFFKAKAQKGEVLSFDQDFQKLRKIRI